LVSKTVVIVIVVLVAGSLLGYGFGLTESGSMVDRVTSLENELNTLKTQSTAMERQLSTLTAEKEQLETQFATSTTGLDALRTEYDAVLADYTALSEQNSQLKVSYDALYTKYQAAVGGVIGGGSDAISKSYSWSFGGKTWGIDLEIPRATIDYFRNHERAGTEDSSVYVTNGGDDVFIQGVADRLHTYANQEGYTSAQEVNFVASFVQSMPYAFDNVTTGYQEYARYPIESLVDGTGDCECKAILTAQLLDLLGYRVALIQLPEHVAVGIYLPNGSGGSYTHDGVRYLYLETTHTGWLVGEMPDQYAGVSATLYPVEPIEIMSIDWTYRYVGRSFTLNVTVKNSGTLEASGYSVKAGFDTGNGMLWAVEETPSLTIGVEKEMNVILSLTAPAGESTRLVVYLINPEGYAIATEYANWFTT